MDVYCVYKTYNGIVYSEGKVKENKIESDKEQKMIARTYAYHDYFKIRKFPESHLFSEKKNFIFWILLECDVKNGKRKKKVMENLAY